MLPSFLRATHITAKLPLASRLRRGGIRTLSSTARRRAEHDWRPRSRSFLNPRTWDLATTAVVGLFALAGGFYVTHLERVPYTGRLRYMDVSPAMEAKSREEAHADILRVAAGAIRPADDPYTILARQLVARILAASDLGTVCDDRPSPAPAGEDAWDPDALRGMPGGWHVYVVDVPGVVNAIALPGVVMVYADAIPYVRTHGALAALLAHEIAHVVARHSLESASYERAITALRVLLSTFYMDFGISKWLSKYLITLPQLRTMETEADTIGLHLLARACFDPQAMVDLHLRLEQLHPGRQITFTMTHPPNKQRTEAMRAGLPRAYALRAESSACADLQEAFQDFTRAVGHEDDLRVESELN